jgi:hypothetical protein
MMNHVRWLTVLAAMGGCASHPPAAETSAVAASRPSPTTAVTPPPATRRVAAAQGSPFLFDEANLPTGFPPPAAVGAVVVKRYPASRVATTGGTDPNGMFMPLFNHIKRHDIAMTAPVEITWTDPQSPGPATRPDARADAWVDARPVAMAFVYRDASLGSPGPDGAVRVVDVPAQTFLSVGVRGGYDRDHFVGGLKQLRDWLAAHPGQYGVTGPPRYLGYNSPLVPPFMRFGEVQLPIAPAAGQP